MVLLISLVAGPGRAWQNGSTLTSYITSLDWAHPWRTFGVGMGCFKFLWGETTKEHSEMYMKSLSSVLNDIVPVPELVMVLRCLL